MRTILDTAERIHAGLDFHLQRHNLLTANLTQIDTPGFRPLDLVRRASFGSVLDTELAAADAGAPAATTPEAARAPGVAGVAGTDRRFQVVQDPAALAGFDGNAVSVDREAVKIAANQIRYDTLAVLATQELSGLSWAANDGRNG